MSIETTDRIRFLDDDGVAGITIDAASGEVTLRDGLEPDVASRMFWAEVHAARGEERVLTPSVWAALCEGAGLDIDCEPSSLVKRVCVLHDFAKNLRGGGGEGEHACQHGTICRGMP